MRISVKTRLCVGFVLGLGASAPAWADCAARISGAHISSRSINDTALRRSIDDELGSASKYLAQGDENRCLESVTRAENALGSNIAPSSGSPAPDAPARP